jgi:hypothetical protein
LIIITINSGSNRLATTREDENHPNVQAGMCALHLQQLLLLITMYLL